MRKSLSGHGGTAAGWKQVAIEKIGFIFFKAERPAVMLLKVVAAQNVPMVTHGLAAIDRLPNASAFLAHQTSEDHPTCKRGNRGEDGFGIVRRVERGAN